MLDRFPLLIELLRPCVCRGVLGPTPSPRMSRLASIRGVSRGSRGTIVSTWPSCGARLGKDDARDRRRMASASFSMSRTSPSTSSSSGTELRGAFSFPLADSARGGGSADEALNFFVGGGGERDIELEASGRRTLC
jgi:hypothetical protein